MNASRQTHLWGPRGYSGNCLMVLDDRREVLEKLYEQVEYVGASDNPYAAKFGSLAELWPQLKKWR